MTEFDEGLEQQATPHKRQLSNRLMGALGTACVALGVGLIAESEHPSPGTGLLIIGGAIAIAEAAANSGVPDQLPQFPEDL